MTDYTISTGDGHGQATAVALKAATDAAVLGVEVIYEGFCLFFFCILHLALQFLCLGNGATVFLVALLLSLAPGCLCLLLLACEFGLFASQFLGLAFALCLGALCFLGSLALSLGYSPLAGLLHLDGHEAVDLGIDGCIALLLFGDDALYGFLLFLQCVHHILLLNLLALKRASLLFTFI